MPQPGESPLARFAHAIVHEDGFSFGIPRLSDDGSLVTVPVLRTAARSRTYTLAGVASDDISAVDVGRIDRLQVRNDSGVRVFLPPGTLFEGRGTASRGICAGVVLGPGSTCEVRVRCVQPAQPIREGAGLRLVQGLAPHPVTQALLSLDQGLVWETVGAFNSMVAEPRPTEIPSEGGQCGAILLDGDGVVAAEICDDPESWQAVARSDAPPRDAAARLALNPAGADRVARQFLERLPQRTYHRVTPESAVAVDASAAWTAIDGRVVHLLAFGRELTDRGLIPGQSGEPSVSPSGARTPFLAEPTAGGGSPEDADVAVAAIAVADTPEVAGVSSAAPRLRRRKVLTSGWDGATFESLERYSHKEFHGDRSAAIRFLVRHELRQRGYMGPHPPTPNPVASPVLEEEEPIPRVEMGRAAVEARIRDFERIAGTATYADWLRKRARLELGRMASATSDETLRAAVQAALDRLPTETHIEEPPEPEEIETSAAPIPLPSPMDVRPLLRRAFAASAGGRYADALILFGEVLDAEPENRTALLGRAVALRRSGKAQEALEALDIVLRVEPRNAAALLNRGRILQEHGDLKGALDTFDILASVAANDWDVWMARGDVLARMGQDQEALRAYAEAVRRNPEDEGLRAKIRGLEKARAAPPPAASPRVPLPRDIQQGQSYVVRERRPDLSLRVLRALVGQKVPSLIITRQPADRYRGEPGLAGVLVLELSHSPGEGHHDPTALVALMKAVDHFVEENAGRGVILLDGIATLVLENGFRDAVLFVERVHETILQSQAVFLVSLAPGDLEYRESALLERSLKVLS